MYSIKEICKEKEVESESIEWFILKLLFQMQKCPEANFLILDWDIVDSGIRLSYRSDRLRSWQAGTR
jgi:hypothetical protein